MIADLHTSISTMKKPVKPHGKNPYSVALLTEPRRFSFNKRNGNRTGKSCFVCRTMGCWSSNHSPSDRLAAIRSNKPERAYILQQLQEEDKNYENNDIQDAVDELDDLNALYLDLTTSPAESTTSPSDNISDENEDGLQGTSAFAAEILDTGALHTISKSTSAAIARRYCSNEFFGVAVDTCCFNYSTGGQEQYMAYCNFVGIRPNIMSSPEKGVKFGIESTTVVGVANCYMVTGSQIQKFDVYISAR